MKTATPEYVTPKPIDIESHIYKPYLVQIKEKKQI